MFHYNVHHISDHLVLLKIDILCLTLTFFTLQVFFLKAFWFDLIVFLFFFKCFPDCLCVGFSLDYKDEAVDSLLALKDRLENPDHSILYKTCSDLTKVHFILHNKALRSFTIKLFLICILNPFVSLPRYIIVHGNQQQTFFFQFSVVMSFLCYPWQHALTVNVALFNVCIKIVVTVTVCAVTVSSSVCVR